MRCDNVAAMRGMKRDDDDDGKREGGRERGREGGREGEREREREREMLSSPSLGLRIEG